MPTIVTIDGPAGAGKSSVAAEVATLLGLTHLNTGLLYRALAWVVLFRFIDPHDAEGCTEVAQSVRLSFVPEGIEVQTTDGLTCLLTKSELKGNPRIAAAVSSVCRHPGLRESLVDLQREAGKDGCVAEGRDMGWRIFPEAQLKIWLTADEEVRIERIEADKGLEVALETIARDAMDAEHAMMPAADAVAIDTTHLKFAAVVRRIICLTAESDL